MMVFETLGRETAKLVRKFCRRIDNNTKCWLFLLFVSYTRYDDYTIRSDWIKQGAIIYLPPRERTTEKYNIRVGRRCHSVRPRDGDFVGSGIFGHPILVISRTAETPAQIHFCLVSEASVLLCLEPDWGTMLTRACRCPHLATARWT